VPVGWRFHSFGTSGLPASTRARPFYIKPGQFQGQTFIFSLVKKGTLSFRSTNPWNSKLVQRLLDNRADNPADNAQFQPQGISLTDFHIFPWVIVAIRATA